MDNNTLQQGNEKCGLRAEIGMQNTSNSLDFPTKKSEDLYGKSEY
jgi:hypothetical protein